MSWKRGNESQNDVSQAKGMSWPWLWRRKWWMKREGHMERWPQYPCSCCWHWEGVCTSLCHWDLCSHTSIGWGPQAGISLLEAEDLSVLLSQRQHGSYPGTERVFYAHFPGKARWNMTLGYFLPLCFTIKVKIWSGEAAAKSLISTLMTTSAFLRFHFDLHGPAQSAITLQFSWVKCLLVF